ncbi:MAG: hypothetical protein ABWX83_10635 [Luteibacter sp.]
MNRVWKNGLVVACVASITACASITGGRYQKLNVQPHTAAGQNITGATCRLSNDRDSVNVTTPGVAKIHRSSSPLDVSCMKDGAQIAHQSYPSSLRGMVWGNILIGGLIGIVIDFSNGAAHHYANQLQLVGTDAGSVASSAGLPGAPVAPAQSVDTKVVGNAPAGDNAQPHEQQIATAFQPGGPASLDPRIGTSMFNAAQNVAAIQQCDRMIRVLEVDGQHALFFTQCQGRTQKLHIECTADSCVPLLPPEG